MRRRLLATGGGPLKTFHECRSEEPSRSGAFTVCSFPRCFVTDVCAVGPEMQKTRQNATILYQFEFPATHRQVLNRDSKNSSKCNDSCSSYYNDLPIWIFHQPQTVFDQRRKKLVKTQRISIFHKEEDFLNLALIYRFENFNPSKGRDCKPSICCYRCNKITTT